MGVPLYAELRYWPELAGLLADGRFRAPARAGHRAPVLLIPGFMAGDASLTLLARWLRRRGHTVRLSGIRINAGCAGRDLTRLEQVLAGFDEPAIVIGQSRGGTLARALAARRPESVAAVVMLGSPVLDPLAVSPGVMRTVRSMARLGDLGVPGVFSSECRDGDCCSEYYALLRAPLTEGMAALMIYSRIGRHRRLARVPRPQRDVHRDQRQPLRDGRQPTRLRGARAHSGAGGGSAGVNQMSAQDAMFLHVENDVTPMHIGGVSIFEGPPPSFADLTAMVAGKLDHTPRYRQKIRFVPLGVSEPVWVDDRYFDLGYHLRHTAVPAPGSESQLRAMAARVFSQHLDRARPLWEIWMVEGLSEGRWALLSKVHHCMVDGVAATDLMSVMFDDAANPPSPRPSTGRPAPSPAASSSCSAGWQARALDPASQLRSALSALAPGARAAR